jgi:hypothetical protein
MAKKRGGGRPKVKDRGPERTNVVPSTVVSIDRAAIGGRAGIHVGSRVRILGSGLYAGELAIVERLVASVIPAASVRTEAGRTRMARTIDLEPAPEVVPDVS